MENGISSIGSDTFARFNKLYLLQRTEHFRRSKEAFNNTDLSWNPLLYFHLPGYSKIRTVPMHLASTMIYSAYGTNMSDDISISYFSFICNMYTILAMGTWNMT